MFSMMQGNEVSSEFRLCVDRAVRARQRKEEMRWSIFNRRAGGSAHSYLHENSTPGKDDTTCNLADKGRGMRVESSEDGHIAHQRGEAQRGGLRRAPREK